MPQKPLLVQCLTSNWLAMRTEFTVPSCLKNHTLLLWKLFCFSFRALNHNRFCATRQDTQGRAADASSLRIRVLVRVSMSVLRYVKNKSTRFHTFFCRSGCRTTRGLKSRSGALCGRCSQSWWLSFKSVDFQCIVQLSTMVTGAGVSLKVRRRFAWMSSKMETRTWRWFTRFVMPLFPSRRILWLSTFSARLPGTNWRSQLHDFNGSMEACKG